VDEEEDEDVQKKAKAAFKKMEAQEAVNMRRYMCVSLSASLSASLYAPASASASASQVELVSS
jgi:uncharacterized protein YuzB (UPF0349 family)